MTAKTYNSKGKAGEERFYIPPIAMGLRWMGHPIIFACVERMGHIRSSLSAWREWAHTIICLLGEHGHTIILACVEIDLSR
jgi:hypothetical protein